MIGKQLGHYKIVSQLGRGGMASVYMAEQLGLERRVALKILQPSLAADEVIVQRFQQEARIAANLHHAHVVTIYDVGEVDGLYYIAMRYIEGENLGQLLRREGRLEPERALAMLDQVAEALDFAHSRGVLHRDVKPANVMVEEGDILTLTDFGIARAGEASHLTATRMVIGTPEYMSPEQARGEPVDKRSDLYALGVLMYEALGGRPPFSAASTPSLLYLHVHEPPPPLSQWRPDLPQTVSDAVSRALAKDPNDRYQSGREMIAAVRAALAAGATPEGPPTSGLTHATMVEPTFGRPGPTPVPMTPPPMASPATPAGGGRVAPPPPPLAPAGPTRMEPAARGGTRTLTPPPVPAGTELRTRATGTMATEGLLVAPDTRKKPNTRWIGPAIAAIALIAVGVLVLTQSGLIGDATATATPTAGIAKPTTQPTVQQAAQPSVTGPTAEPKPTEAPTAAPKPTSPPTAAPTATAVPTATPVPPTATPNPSARVSTAQAAVAAGDLSGAIAQLQALRDDPGVKADPQVAGTVNDTLRQTYVAYGNHLLDQGKLDDAWSQFGEALKITPNDPDATDGQKRVILNKNYGIMEANWGKDDEAAIKALEDNMTLNPDFKDTRQKLHALLIAKADRLLNGGDRDGAYAVLMRALEVVPDSPEAKLRLQPYTPTPVPYVPPPPPPSNPPPQRSAPPANTAPAYNPPPSNPPPARNTNPAPAPAPADPGPSRPFVPPGSPV